MSKHLGLDLLETFVTLVELSGDASAAAKRLEISQPTMSKRLAALRQATTDPEDQPWVILKGKRWLLTTEGERVRGMVTDLVQRYRQVEDFIGASRTDSPIINVACGQLAAIGFVGQAIEKFSRANPACRVKLSTPRGRLRIAGVAAGQFDLAVVTDSETTIREAAGIELFVQSLCMDQFVVAANPSSRTSWASKWKSLPVRRSLNATDLLDLPLILPEQDAHSRRQFDAWYFRGTQKQPWVKIESGGWSTILQFADAGLGIGFATRTAIDVFRQFGRGRTSKLADQYRLLDPDEFVPDRIRLVARKIQGRDEPDLTRVAQSLSEMIVAACKK